MKSNTVTFSNVGSVSLADRTLGVCLVLGLIRGYRLLISPYFRGSCRFLPSCADYAAEAVERHGLIRGCWLAARRLGRCHPLCAAGHDPVPLPHSASRGSVFRTQRSGFSIAPRTPHPAPGTEHPAPDTQHPAPASIHS